MMKSAENIDHVLQDAACVPVPFNVQTWCTFPSIFLCVIHIDCVQAQPCNRKNELVHVVGESWTQSSFWRIRSLYILKVEAEARELKLVECYVSIGESVQVRFDLDGVQQSAS